MKPASLWGLDWPWNLKKQEQIEWPEMRLSAHSTKTYCY